MQNEAVMTDLPWSRLPGLQPHFQAHGKEVQVAAAFLVMFSDRSGLTDGH